MTLPSSAMNNLKPKDFSVDLESLRTLLPIQSMLPAHVEALMTNMKEHWLFAGDTLFTVGQHDQRHYYLISGSLELSFADGSSKRLEAHNSLLPICDDQPRICHTVALEDCSLVSFDCKRFDELLTWSQVAEFLLIDIAFDRDLDEDADWMSSVLKSNLFLKVPPTNMRMIYQHINPINVDKSDVIIRQGEYGDRCYFIKQGSAVVTRRLSEKDEPIHVADIYEGRCFGEGALVHQTVRNASVTMTSDGVLMMLLKNNFLELLKEPMSLSIEWLEWAAQSDQNIVIDVRTEIEYQQGHLPRAINIPLHLLRLKSRNLATTQHYSIYCNTGNRAKAAACLLQQQNLNCVSLKGGSDAIAMANKATLWTQQDYIFKNGEVVLGRH